MNVFYCLSFISFQLSIVLSGVTVEDDSTGGFFFRKEEQELNGVWNDYGEGKCVKQHGWHKYK